MLDRRVGQLELFEKPSGYSAFEKILAEADRRARIRIAAYCSMPNDAPQFFVAFCGDFRANLA
jgi:hypothetical protein